ncbi:MAG: response regulator [Desulfobulbaceae bacterium]|nr:response regulator [Desulfobulbaceae bacterium]
MEEKPLTILVVEDDAAHAEAIFRAFDASDLKARLELVTTLQEFREKVAQIPPDIAIMDLNLPDGRAVDVMTSPPEDGQFPTLLMTSYGNEHVAVEAIKSGALDYIVKSAETFANMPHTVEGALREWRLLVERKQADRDTREREARFHALSSQFNALLDALPDRIILHSPDLRVIWANRAALGELSADAAEAIECGKIYCMWYNQTAPCDLCPVRESLKSGESTGEVVTAADGKIWELRSIPVKDAEQIVSVLEIGRDITEHRQTEMALRESEQNFRTLVNSGMALIWTAGTDKLCSYFNQVWLAFTGRTLEQEQGNGWLEGVHPDDLQRCVDIYTTAFDRREKFSMEYRLRRYDGEYRWISDDGCPRYDSKGEFIGYIGHCLDINDRKEAEEENAKLGAQLQQAQKMEAVALLAGGVAHDFNNMLGVIIGHAEMALDKIDPTLPYRADLESIQMAAKRSADITRQLLTFARKQNIQPKVLDLNETLEGMLKMLRRLIGESINLAWYPGTGLWPIMADPSQIDQILANLCINARDAISGIGTIIVETANSTFDEACCTAHPEFLPGEYVQISVTDNGCGMDQLTMIHAFEPFYTTKTVGKGTGLGLATVDGAVKQNKGFINVNSLPNKGTTFSVFLPRYSGEDGQELIASSVKPPARGHEIILLVEDEVTILEMTKQMLQGLGYTVLPASTPGEAIRLASEFAGEIHLLLTDVIMPEMDGRTLSEQLLRIHPKMKRAFMSGYTANIIAHQGVISKEVCFIQKPFSMAILAAKLRELLGSE